MAVTTHKFDPTSLLITNELTPVAINLRPAPRQVLWLFNPYLNDIKLKFISHSAQLSIDKVADGDVVVRSQERAPLIVTFSPQRVGRHEVDVLN